MSATTTARKRASKSAPAEAPAESQAPPALDLAAAVASEQVSKAQRIYVDVPDVPRVPTPDGTLATVQREQRADESLGEYLLAEVRINQKDKSESVTRYSIGRLQVLKDALAAQGITILR